MRTFIIFILLSIFLNINAQEKEFTINSKTTFVDEKGEPLTFKDFVFLTTNFKSKLLPTFLSNGKLNYITIVYPNEAINHIGKHEVVKTTIKNSENNPINNIIKKDEVNEISEKYNLDFYTNRLNTDSYSNVKELLGQTAPHFYMRDQYGIEVDLDKLKGTVVVLKFWFSRCAPCIEEMPKLNRLAEKYNNRNIKFYAPSVEKKELTEKFLSTYSFNYSVIFAAQDLAALYKTPGYPTHVVIGKKGKIRKVVVGKVTDIYKVLNIEIEKALLLQGDDLDIQDLDENESFVLNENTIIKNEIGIKITVQEYINKLNTGEYKVYKLIKQNGNTQLLIIKK